MRTLTVTPPPTTWERLVQVPHRAWFLTGISTFLLLSVWWSLVLPHPLLAERPAMLVHGLMMPLCLFSPFMLGFIFTAGPRWINVSSPKGHLPLAIAQFVGVLLALAGFAAGGNWPLAGLLLLLVVWLRTSWLWFDCIRRAPAGDQRHARYLLIAMLTGGIAFAVTIAWTVTGDGLLWLVARNLSLWGCILPIFLIVAHRMIPFFTQSVIPQRQAWRPIGMLQGWLLACAGLTWALSTGHNTIAAVIALLFCLASAWTAIQWSGCTLRGAYGGNRLLAMLHLSFAWLPVGLLLLALEQAGYLGNTASVHAIGLGFCTTMLVGFVTRVSLGHSGRPLRPSNLQWTLYLGQHLVTLLRVAAALLGLHGGWLHGVAGLWLLCIVLWACSMLPIYLRPRADGQPG